MVLRRLISGFCLFFGLFLVSYAQIRIVPQDRLDAVVSPRLSCDSASLGFNVRRIVAPKMNEDDAPSVFVYELENKGTERLEIKALRTTCSCLTARAGKSALEPGEKTEISVRYDPEGHPGKFERRIFVYTRDGRDPAAVLTLAVDVETGSDLSREWPLQMGQIRLRRTEMSFIEGQRSVEKLRFINLGVRPLNLTCEETFLPECLTFSTRPDVVPPGEVGEIVIAYEPDEGPLKNHTKVILKGLGLPPSRSSITVRTVKVE